MTVVGTLQERDAVPGTFRWWAPPAVAVTYVVASRLGAAVVAPAAFLSATPAALGLALLAGLIAGLTLGPLAARLPVPFGGRMLALFLAAWVFLAASNTVEALLYLPVATALRAPVVGAVQALGLAAALAGFFPPARVTTTLPAALRAHLAARTAGGWLWRGVLLAVAWVPVYLVFVTLDGILFLSTHLAVTGDSPFAHPDVAAIAGGQLVRGALHVVVLFVLAALLRGRRLVLWLPLVIAVLNAWVPLVQPVAGFDTATRVANLLEITCDAVVFGLLAAAMLRFALRSPRR